MAVNGGRRSAGRARAVNSGRLPPQLAAELAQSLGDDY
jgi:hypothetical protein